MRELDIFLSQPLSIPPSRPLRPQSSVCDCTPPALHRPRLHARAPRLLRTTDRLTPLAALPGGPQVAEYGKVFEKEAGKSINFVETPAAEVRAASQGGMYGHRMGHIHPSLCLVSR